MFKKRGVVTPFPLIRNLCEATVLLHLSTPVDIYCINVTPLKFFFSYATVYIFQYIIVKHTII